MALLDFFKRTQTKRRNFEAAKGTRHTGDWVTSRGAADIAIKSDLVSLRDRARDLERNDGYAESILMELESNIIGQHGIRVNPLARKNDARTPSGVLNKTDTAACEKIASAWADYSRRGNFDVTRAFSRAAFERLAIRTVARDGGILTRMIEGYSGNDYGFAVQGLEMDCLNAKYSDPKRRIHMGIEYNEWDAPIAFHIEKIDTKNTLTGHREITSIPAENMLHVYMARRLTQSQGFSWMAPVMLRLRHLSKYEEAELIAARAHANKIGFFEQDGDTAYTGDEDDNGNIQVPSGPNEWESLPNGVKAHLIDPTHPNGNYPDFRKAILRGVCAGICLNYNTLAKDLEGVSFSSIRQGVLSERDIFRLIQSWFIDSFSIPIYERWLKMALTMGQIEGLTIKDYGRVKHADFSGRNWPWVDPAKDIQAINEEITLGVNSRQSAARDRGKDFAKIVAENEADQELMESAGLYIPNITPPPVAIQTPTEEPTP